jgi:hypothetical protein
MKTSRNPSSTLARAIGEWPMISAASTPGRPEWDRSTPRQRDAQERVGEQVPDTHPAAIRYVSESCSVRRTTKYGIAVVIGGKIRMIRIQSSSRWRKRYGRYDLDSE